MRTIFEDLFCGYLTNNIKNETGNELEIEIEKNKKRLKQNLSKKQKRLLL